VELYFHTLAGIHDLYREGFNLAFINFFTSRTGQTLPDLLEK
jgi:hypothetical protein